MTEKSARSCMCGYNSKCVLQAVLTWWAIYDVLLSWKGKVSRSRVSDRRVMALTKESAAWYLSTTVLVRLKNAECILESSLPFCHWGDIARWGERLIEGLACIRMWLLIEVWEGCQSLWLYLPLPSPSQPLSPPSVCLLPARHSHSSSTSGGETPATTTTTTTLQYHSGFFHTVHPRRVQPPLSVNISPHFLLVSSRWQTHTAAPPPPVLLPSSSALLKGKAAVGGASREEGEGQLNEWQNKDEKAAFVWMDFFFPPCKCHLTSVPDIVSWWGQMVCLRL